MIYPVFVYEQGGFRTINRRFGEIAEQDRPHCGLQRLLLQRYRFGGEGMKQSLASANNPIPLPPDSSMVPPVTVKLLVLVGCDGSVLDTDYVDGPPGLFKAANDAVRKWKYRQSVMNGVPCEVLTTATVAFRANE